MRAFAATVAVVFAASSLGLPLARAGEKENARDASAEMAKLKESYKKVDAEVAKIETANPHSTARANRKLLERAMAGAQELNKKVTALWLEAQNGMIKDAMKGMVDLQKKSEETQNIIKAKALEIKAQRLAEAAKAKKDKELAAAKEAKEKEEKAKQESSASDAAFNAAMAESKAKSEALEKEIAAAMKELDSLDGAQTAQTAQTAKSASAPGLPATVASASTNAEERKPLVQNTFLVVPAM